MNEGWKKSLKWVGAIAFVYIGSHLTLPGLNNHFLAGVRSLRGGNPLLRLYDAVFQGGLNRGAVLGLGIMPYLTARIYMRLWRAVRPDAEISKGKTRALTIALSIIQSVGVATYLQRLPGVVANPGPGFVATTVLSLTVGSLVAMWLGEQLTEPGDEAAEPINDDSALRGQIDSGNFAHATDSTAARPQPDSVGR